jgi:hypothetical protein
LARDALYLVSPDQGERLRRAPGEHRCGDFDGLTICSAADIYPAWRHLVTAE